MGKDKPFLYPLCVILYFIVVVAATLACHRFRVFDRVPYSLDWPYLAGFIYAVVLSSYPIRCLLRELYKAVEKERSQSTGGGGKPHWMSAIVGHVETTLYFSAVLLGKWQFIPVWLGLKVVITWKGSIGRSQNTDERQYLGIFFIGNGCSLAFAVIGASMVRSIIRPGLEAVLALPVLLLIGTWVLIRLTRSYAKAAPSAS